jgi:hypothetical protein
MARASLEFHLAPIVRLDPYFTEERRLECETIEKHLIQSNSKVYAEAASALDKSENNYIYDYESMQFKKKDVLRHHDKIIQVGKIKSSAKPEQRRITKKSYSSSSIHFMEMKTYKMDLEENAISNDALESQGSGCFSKVYFNRLSKTRPAIEFLHILNLIYIAFAVPFTVAFGTRGLKNNEAFLVFESLSLAV